MRVLFFVEPFPVRGAPLEYRWIAEQWLTLSRELAPRGAAACFAVSDAVKRSLAGAGAELYSPADFGLATTPPAAAAEADRDWVRLMREPDAPAWRPFVDALLERARPDAVLSWTVNAPLRAACAARGILLVHQELGLMRAPNPVTYYADPIGLNGASALPQLWPQLRGVALAPAQALELDWLAREALPASGRAREDIARELGIAPGRRVLAVFLQVSRDSNVLMWSRVAGNEALVRLVAGAAREADFEVVVKPHPREPALPAACAEAGLRPLPAGVTTEALFELADAVFTVNSSVGFEALARGKVVYAFGDSPYAGRGCTRDLGGDAAALRAALARERFALDAEAEETRRRLVHFIAFRYLVSAAEMFDPDAFCGRLARWRRLAEARAPLAAWFEPEPAGARRRDWSAEVRGAALEKRLAFATWEIGILRGSAPMRLAAVLKRIPGLHAAWRLLRRMFG